MAETTTITKPSPIIEASLTNFLKWIDPLSKGALKLDAAGKPTFAGIDTSAYAPKVAGQHALQTGAVADAAGLGSLVGPGAELAGDVVPGSVEAYMSPYQQQVIDAQMEEFDRQAAINKTKV